MAERVVHIEVERERRKPGRGPRWRLVAACLGVAVIGSGATYFAHSYDDALETQIQLAVNSGSISYDRLKELQNLQETNRRTEGGAIFATLGSIGIAIQELRGKLRRY